MESSARRILQRVAIGMVAAGVVVAAASLAVARPRREVARSFTFPAVSANGVTGDLIPPVGSASSLLFQSGKVAIGELPFGMPEPAQARQKRVLHFLRPAHGAPRARLMLNGVVGGDGQPLSNSGNQLVIDAVVDPPAAALMPPPFTFAFDIAGGAAGLDVALPIQPLENAAVRVQVTGVRLIDPSGQVFGVLGFELVPMPLTPTPQFSPTPVATKSGPGRCFIGSKCSGHSFAATQDQCCGLLADPNAAGIPGPTSWCAPDQFDPQTGLCADGACVTCQPQPPPPGCDARDVCAGQCTVTCDDGHQAVGVCTGDATCACSARCMTPPGPCGDRNACSGPCKQICSNGQIAVGQCTASGADAACACSAHCEPPPPNPCDDPTTCSGSCTRICDDGSVAKGECIGAGSAANRCACSAQCGSPPPNPCDDPTNCSGSCTRICADGSVAKGECTGADAATNRCACSAQCEPPPPNPCDDPTTCSGSCTRICADGSVAKGECTGADTAANRCACSAQCEPPPPNPCDDPTTCSGSCTRICADGSVAKGECLGADSAGDRCACTAECDKPPPCPIGQCVGVMADRCSGIRCQTDADCPSANTVCDFGERCPCLLPTPPPPPHGHLCCACTVPAARCYDLSFVEAEPVCPRGCETVMNAECDPSTNGCRPLAPCTDDADCADDNACTIDRCTDAGCVHDCVCVNANGCGPGPAGATHHSP